MLLRKTLNSKRKYKHRKYKDIPYQIIKFIYFGQYKSLGSWNWVKVHRGTQMWKTGFQRRKNFFILHFLKKVYSTLHLYGGKDRGEHRKLKYSWRLLLDSSKAWYELKYHSGLPSWLKKKICQDSWGKETRIELQWIQNQ